MTNPATLTVRTDRTLIRVGARSTASCSPR